MPLKKPRQEKNSRTFGLQGVGKHIAKHLARLDITSSHDLLFHFPLRYQDRTKISAIRDLIPNSEAVLEGEIKKVTQPLRGRTKFLCELSDGTGRLTLRFFNILPYQTKLLKVGTRLRCFSVIKLTQSGLEMIHPEFQVLSESKLAVPEHLTPIYPATEGLSQYMLRKLTTSVLTKLEDDHCFDELLPVSVLQALTFPTFKEAIKFVHRPKNDTSIENLMAHKTFSQKRLIFEELLAHRISLLEVKRNFKLQQAIPLLNTKHLIEQFLTSLPFSLTQAQERVIKEISFDLTKSSPMLRLVQGDVGSGKTVIAAIAMLYAVTNGYQAAMMAPTELLAEQHFRVFKKWFEAFDIRIVFLSSHVKGVARKQVLQAIQTNEAHIILGTHALFQEEVIFSNLALLVVDEQHRFGVQQRALFRAKGMQQTFYPHQLMMTATPIPRTLAMSFYADLDVSMIDELPPGRTPIVTSLIANARRDEVISKIYAACQQGRQVYGVCSLIEESEFIPCQAATQTAAELQTALPALSVGLIHGRMHNDEKEKTMRAFQEGKMHVLVATTVIEVGVDVANASLMIIENAERLGLSQLHQLRGRVGRGATASYCLLLYQHPLSDLAKERLSVMRETTDGFKIAQRDLELRGPGEV